MKYWLLKLVCKVQSVDTLTALSVSPKVSSLEIISVGRLEENWTLCTLEAKQLMTICGNCRCSQVALRNNSCLLDFRCNVWLCLQAVAAYHDEPLPCFMFCTPSLHLTTDWLCGIANMTEMREKLLGFGGIVALRKEPSYISIQKQSYDSSTSQMKDPPMNLQVTIPQAWLMQ